MSTPHNAAQGERFACLLAAMACYMPEWVRFAGEEAVALCSGRVRSALAQQAAAPLRRSAQQRRRRARGRPPGTQGLALAGQLREEGAPARRARRTAAVGPVDGGDAHAVAHQHAAVHLLQQPAHGAQQLRAGRPAAAGRRRPAHVTKPARRQRGQSCSVQSASLTSRGVAAALPGTSGPVLRSSVLLRPHTQADVLPSAEVCAGTRVRLSSARGPRRRGVRVLGLHADEIGLGAHHLRAGRCPLSWCSPGRAAAPKTAVR